MNTRHGQAIKMASVVLVGGLVAGGLLAAVVPTNMNRQGQNWRDAIGLRKVAAVEGASDGAIPVYAPPEDLEPIQWQPAAAEYPSPVPQQRSADASTDFLADLSHDYQPEPAIEALPAELTRERAPGTATAAVDEDDAASSAQVASTAVGASSTAADLRERESATTGSAAAAPATPAETQAVSGSA